MSGRRSLPKTREQPEGVEKFCAKCDTWWPADVDFFFSDASSPDGLFYCCKACYREWQARTTGRTRRPTPASAPVVPDLVSVPWLGTIALGCTS
ncbi:MAG: hypothetical protein EOP37_03395 [Rubrivivax sp.]|nr:MAG: hypothetical protein EOP37_03395 [Rubrivivax sp.]